MSRGLRAFLLGAGMAAGCAAIGACVGAAYQLNHPELRGTAYWLSGALIGLAIGIVAGGIAAVAYLDSSAGAPGRQ